MSPTPTPAMHTPSCAMYVPIQDPTHAHTAYSATLTMWPWCVCLRQMESLRDYALANGYEFPIQAADIGSVSRAWLASEVLPDQIGYRYCRIDMSAAAEGTHKVLMLLLHTKPGLVQPSTMCGSLICLPKVLKTAPCFGECGQSWCALQ